MTEPCPRMRLVVISGLSGSGKSVALKALEDEGYCCIDNLPAGLLMAVVDHLAASAQTEVALSIDARSASGLAELPAALTALRQRLDLKVLFIDAKDDTLLRRFSETRRRHPLSGSGRSLTEALALERELLAPLTGLAHHIDTSGLSANALRAWVKSVCELTRAGFTLVFQSFGFKHGIPLDADLVFDVRCLPNPHYEAALRPLTGRDPEVAAFLAGKAEVGAMLEDIRAYVEKWLPAYIADNRSYFTVALGCTGGQHRSVYFAETLAATFAAHRPVLVRHRELA